MKLRAIAARIWTGILALQVVAMRRLHFEPGAGIPPQFDVALLVAGIPPVDAALLGGMLVAAMPRVC